MKYIMFMIILLFHISFQSGLRSDFKRINKEEEDRIVNKEEIEDPLIIYSNFTKDIYTSERKVYCVDYYLNNVSDPYYSNLKIKYSFGMLRDKIKDTDCIKLNLYHPFIVHDKNCYVSVEYEYKNKTFTHRIDFKVHENNVLCFSLTIIYSIIAQAVGYLIVLYIKRDIFEKDDMCGCCYVYCCPFTYVFTFLWILAIWILGGVIAIIIPFIIYPYSFVVIGVVIGVVIALCIAIPTKARIEHYVDISIMTKNHEIEIVAMTVDDFDIVKYNNGYIKINENKIIKYSDCINVVILKYYNKTIEDDPPLEIFKILSPICSCLCSVVFLVVFFAESTLRKNMFKASRDVLLSLEYQAIIAVVYVCILAIGTGIYALIAIYYYCKENCKCCNNSSTISPT